MLMIAMMIAMIAMKIAKMKNWMSEGFMVILRELLMLMMITIILMIIVMMKNSMSKSFYGDAAGLNDDDHDYYDHEDSNNSEFDARKFYSVATGLDDVDSDHDDKEFSGMWFYGVNKNYERVPDHCHYTDKHRAAAHSICNLR